MVHVPEVLECLVEAAEGKSRPQELLQQLKVLDLALVHLLILAGISIRRLVLILLLLGLISGVFVSLGPRRQSIRKMHGHEDPEEADDCIEMLIRIIEQRQSILSGDHELLDLLQDLDHIGIRQGKLVALRLHSITVCSSGKPFVICITVLEVDDLLAEHLVPVLLLLSAAASVIKAA